MIGAADNWLRWELVKTFRAPIDSDAIKNANPAQLIWYAFMMNKDREEVFESKLNMTEYLASFINGEAVRKTREARESQKVVADEDFDQLIRDKFGRDLNPEALSRATRIDAEIKVNTPQPAVKKKGSININDIKKYLDMELDDVKFIPKKR